MKIRTNLLGIICLVVIFMVSSTDTFSALTLSGPSTVCPGSSPTFTVSGINCGSYYFDHIEWYVSNPTYVDYDYSTTSSSQTFDITGTPLYDDLITVSVAVFCKDDSNNVYQTGTANFDFTLYGFNLSISPSSSSIPCNRSLTWNLQVNANSSLANSFNWSVSGGSYTVNSPNSITVTKNSCGGGINVSCTATRNICGGMTLTKTVVLPIQAPTFPTTISGPSGLCPGVLSSSTYSATSSPTSGCNQYNWYFEPSTSSISISNPSSCCPTLTLNSSPAVGKKYLKCKITACGEETILTKEITVCNNADAPTSISAARLGSTCYYKFIANGACGVTYDWEVNGVQYYNSNNNNEISVLFGPGSYLIKVRVNNGCGTSPWYTQTFSYLPPFSGCTFKAAPASIPMTLKNEQKFQIFPNPSTDGTFNLISNFPIEKEFEIELIGIDGKKLFNHYVHHENSTVDISFLPAGIYFVKILSPTNPQVLKILKN